MIDRDRYRIYHIRQRDEAKIDRYQANLKTEEAMLNNARSGAPSTSNQSGSSTTTGNGSMGNKQSGTGVQKSGSGG